MLLSDVGSIIMTHLFASEPSIFKSYGSKQKYLDFCFLNEIFFFYSYQQIDNEIL